MSEETVQPTPTEIEASILNPDNHPSRVAAERSFYPERFQIADELKHTIAKDLAPVRDARSLTAAQTEQLAQTHIDLLTGVVNSRDAKEVHELIARHLIKPASDDDVAAWTPQANKLIRETYKDDADQLMKDAKTLISKRPALAKVLNETGLGSNPKVVKAIVDMARRRRGRGVL